MGHQPEICLQGVPISGGIAIGNPYILHSLENPIPEIVVPTFQVEREVIRYQKALEASRKDVINLRDQLTRKDMREAFSILDAHLEIMSDPLLNHQIEEQIRQVSKNAEHVFHVAVRRFKEKFQSINNPFFQERFYEIQDIAKRILGHLQHSACNIMSHLPFNSVVFAVDVSPIEVAEASLPLVAGFVTRGGASTSHAAIIAKAKGIPYVARVDFPDIENTACSLVIVDGVSGTITLNPSAHTLKRYKTMQKKLHDQAEKVAVESHFPVQTSDGTVVRVLANIESLEEIEVIHRFGASGIGLFRTEYLALSSGFPNEEEQFSIYKQLAEAMGSQPVVIRVFDVGADKAIYSLSAIEELNPALGCRALRFLLREKRVFKTQLRALLRAKVYGDIRILLPMVCNVDELRQAKELIEESKEELEKEGAVYGNRIQCGCMIEVPAAAINADILARECDFFSIGTNDLVQYALAIDRTNHLLSHFYDVLDPAILRFVNLVVTSANEHDIPVSLCGEIASDSRCIPLLIGMGIKELSVSSRLLPVVKNAVRTTILSDAREMARQALKMLTAQEVRSLLNYNKVSHPVAQWEFSSLQNDYS